MRFIINLKPVILFIFCCAVDPSLFAQAGVIINKTSQLEYVEKNIFYLQDNAGNLSFNAVSQLPDSAFTFQPKSSMSFGNTKAVWWFKLNIENKTSEEIFLLFQNQELLELDYYVIDTAGKIDSVETVGRSPFEKSLFKINTPVFNIGKKPLIVFLRVKATTMWLPIQAGTLAPIVSEIHHIDIISVLVIGIMLALAFYNLVFFFLLKDRLYLYYFAYVFFSVCLIIFNRGYFNEFLFSVYPSLKSIPNQLNTLVAIFTILFTAKYLDTKKRAPLLHKILWIFLVATILIRLMYLLPFQPWYNVSFQLLIFLMMLYTLALGVYIYIKGYKPALFYILAFSFMYIGVFVTILGFSGIISFNSIWVRNAYHIGAVMEAFILSFAVAYRFNLYKKEALEKELQFAKERERITADLHDDVGATLSSMHIYGDLAKNMWETRPQQSIDMVEKITVQSKELMNRISDIIWSLKPADEEKYTLDARVKNYANELLSPKNIVCEIEIDEKIASKIINPDVRKNLLLIIKEGINNIAKYSQCIASSIKLIQQNEQIILLITDDGQGFETKIIKSGNGLGNMEQRCKLLKGTFNLKSAPGQGTAIKCEFLMASISCTV